MVLDTSLLKTHPYKVWIMGKWSNPRKGMVSPLNFGGVVAIEKEAFGLPSTTVS